MPKNEDLCKCPIIATHIVFNSMLLMDDSTWKNFTPDEIEDKIMELGLLLTAFDSNKCGKRLPPGAFRGSDLGKLIKNIDPNIPYSKQNSEQKFALDAANDWALDNTKVSL